MLTSIIDITLEAWRRMPAIPRNTLEDPITLLLIRALRKVKDERNLPFQIHPQMVLLPDNSSTNSFRTDIQFVLGPKEDVYFVFEAKRVNVLTKAGKIKADATKYVNLGLMRFVAGQYSDGLPDAGMIAYVMDGNGATAKTALQSRFKKDRSKLGIPPTTIVVSRLCPTSTAVFATEHAPAGRTIIVHHILLNC